MLNFKLIIFLFLLSLISTKNNIYVCKPKDTEKKIEIGNDVTLCIHAVNLDRKVAFKIKVDDYSVISIKDGFLGILNSLEKETNIRRLDYRNLVKENELQINGSSLNEISNDIYPEDSNTNSEESSTIHSNEASNISSLDTTNMITNESSNIPSQETTNLPTDTSSIIPSSETNIIQTDEAQSDDTSNEIIEEIKEEFIGQIGNIRTKFPTVRQ